MTDYVTPTTWEQCAAHVEAGGVVEVEDAPGVWINDRAAATIYRGRCGTPDDSWVPRRLVPIESAAPANGVPDVPTGAERYLAERLADPEYRAAYEAAAPVTGDDLRERIARAIYADDVENERTDFREGVAPCYYDNADAVLAVLPPQPAPSPVPPWPGAVLSGLVDEDGEPTWLAQAGQVRGEPIRCSRNLSWTKTWGYGPGMWVEVRAPRAVAEPATERVPWWEAVGREVTDQDGERVPIEHVQCGDGAGPSVTAYNAAERRDTRLLRVPIPVRGDGTVEVLKDGDR